MKLALSDLYSKGKIMASDDTDVYFLIWWNDLFLSFYYFCIKFEDIKSIFSEFSNKSVFK